jgi:hypothetical protein
MRPGLFDCCALFAYVAVAAETGQNPPDSELTRRMAYDLYEAELRREQDGSDAKYCLRHAK